MASKIKIKITSHIIKKELKMSGITYVGKRPRDVERTEEGCCILRKEGGLNLEHKI